MTTTTEVWRVPIAGRTCEACVKTVTQALDRANGVESAHVDLKQAHAELTVDPAQTDRGAIIRAIETAGYSVPSTIERFNAEAPQPLTMTANGPTSPTTTTLESTPSDHSIEPPAVPEEWDLAIGGIHCASCVNRVETALGRVPGVKDARVNLATERASVVVDPDRVNLEALVDSVAKAGYTARRETLTFGAQSAEQMRRERAEQVAYWRHRLVVGVVLSIPLVILGYGSMFVPSLAYASWVGWCMFGLASVLQVYLGGPYLKGAWQRLLQRSSNMDTLIALGTSTAFLYSTVHMLLGHVHQAHFFMDSGIILTLITLGKYLEVRSRSTAGEAIERLLDMTPKTARVLIDGKEVETNL